jgi:predicted O-methyltransferase YrrM
VPIKAKLKSLVSRGVGLVTEYRENELRDRRNVDLVLSAALNGSDGLPAVRYPVAYVDFLRTCIERTAHLVREVRGDAGAPERAGNRFATLVRHLRLDLPAIDFSVAQEIALIADRNRSVSEPKEFGQWAGDIGLHFQTSSSFGRKGRILFNVVRFARSEHCLELGTAYGMSALFILAALKAYAKSGHLATVEGSEPQFSLGSAMLKRLHGGMVSCHFGKTGNVLPELVKSLGKIDFMFHDCGHSREDYVGDFNQVSEILSPGAVVVFDDIRWEDPTIYVGQARTYEGWKEVVGHPRVKRAVEIDDTLGLLLLA